MVLKSGPRVCASMKFLQEKSEKHYYLPSDVLFLNKVLGKVTVGKYSELEPIKHSRIGHTFGTAEPS